MIILDFTFYYLTLYFTRKGSSLTASTPSQRAAYALGLITTSWIIAIIFFTLVYVLKTKNFDGSYLFILLPIAMGLIWLYQYIYIKKSRYYLLKSSGNFLFNIDENWGIFIAWVILFISFAMPFIVLISNMK